MVDLLFTSFVQIAFCIHQQFDPAVAENAGADGRVVVAAAGADVVFRDEQSSHSLCAQVSWHHEMPDFAPSEIVDFAWTIALMPVFSNQNPAAFADLWEKSFVGSAGVGSYILLVDAVANAASMKFIEDLGAVPVFVEVEGEVRQPSL